LTSLVAEFEAAIGVKSMYMIKSGSKPEKKRKSMEIKEMFTSISI